MPSNALFSSSNNSANIANGSKMLVQFRAGRMNLRDRMLHPDTRKGILYVYQSDDSLMHLCWKDRTTRTVEDDLIIFPDDCEYQKVTQCTTGRVYVLKFKSSGRNLFFWMQVFENFKIYTLLNVISWTILNLSYFTYFRNPRLTKMMNGADVSMKF